MLSYIKPAIEYKPFRATTFRGIAKKEPTASRCNRLISSTVHAGWATGPKSSNASSLRPARAVVLEEGAGSAPLQGKLWQTQRSGGGQRSRRRRRSLRR